MVVKLEISKLDGIAPIEQKLTRLTSELTPIRKNKLSAYLTSDRRATFFKDIWASMALATGIDNASEADVVAWGLQDWSGLTEIDGFALSHPSLLAMQRGAKIYTNRKPAEPLNAAEVRQFISKTSGLLGSEGARFRTVVELDPELPRAAVLSKGLKQRDTFFDFIRSSLRDLEIAARASGDHAVSPPKNAILDWLYELYTNGFEHALRDKSVRLLRLQKHQYPDRNTALRHAQEVPDLRDYLESQDERPSNRNFNLVEASISDFGQGILDGFLSTYIGKAHTGEPRRELLCRLLHHQLSSKSSDPNAGLGINQALKAAHDLDAFVSLRTAEFSMCMRGKLDEAPTLSFREGKFSPVIGTHWQLLLPDLDKRSRV